MSITIKNGDLFTTDAMYICHQVNCRGKMGSGIAKTIREKFPDAYEEYCLMCRYADFPRDLLGFSQIVAVNDKLIVNMFAQENYGHDGKRYTSYNAFRRCLQTLKNAVPAGYKIAFPYGIGCGLGGGDWARIFAIITEELAGEYEVEIWRR